MSAQIGEELQLLLVCIYSGLILVVSYDLIRILRRVRGISAIRSVIEDVLFWTAVAIYLFHIFLKYNYGSPRYYGVGAVALTMILFEGVIGRRLVPWTAEKLKRLLGIVLKPLKKIENGFKLILRKFLRSVRGKLHFRKKDKDNHGIEQSVKG